MAIKVQLLSIDRRHTEHVKRSKADSLVRRLLAIQVAAYVYQRIRVRATDEIPRSTPSHWSGKLPQAEIEQLKFKLPKDPNAVKRSQTLANQANSWCRASEAQREIMSQHIALSTF